MHRASRKGRFGGQGGFTLFEIIMVLLLLGVISYFAATRLFSDDAPTQVAEMELVKNHLRYAQSRAMNSESSWGINFEGASKYYLYRGDSPSTAIRLPGVETSDGKALLVNIQVSGPAPFPLIQFDQFGSPLNISQPYIEIIVRDSNNVDTGHRVKITQNTGFIP